MPKRALAVLVVTLFAAAVSPPVGADSHDELDEPEEPKKVVIFKRNITYNRTTTHGTDIFFPHNSSYKDVEVWVNLTNKTRCHSLDARVAVSPTAPPPLPSKLFMTNISCEGNMTQRVYGHPTLSTYQGKDRPLSLGFYGGGFAIINVTVFGFEWS